MNVTSYVKDEASYKVTLNDDDVVRNVEISREFLCSCNKKQYVQAGKYADR